VKNSEELIQALKEERAELLQKIHRLETFLISDDFKKIDGESSNLLFEQWEKMRGYEKTLCKRIAHEVAKQYNKENKEK
jgi:hypothetical protein